MNEQEQKHASGKHIYSLLNRSEGHTRKEVYKQLEIEDEPWNQCKVGRSKSLHEYSFVGFLVRNSLTENYLIGVLLMLVATFMWTVVHIGMKLMYVFSPTMSPFDPVLWMGLFLLLFSLIYAKVEKVNLNILSYKPKMQCAILLRAFLGLVNNFCLCQGLQYISVGKAVLIYSLSPIFCAIIAAIFLKEKITWKNIALILLSIVGIYLLTLNKSEDPKVASDETLGYCLILASAFWYGLTFVVLRTLSLGGVHILVPLFYFGLGSLVQSIFIMIFLPGLLHLSEYSGYVLLCFIAISISFFGGQLALMSSTKYSDASKLAPISYSENILTILADVLVFHYHFVMTDIIGIVIITFCLAIPIVLKEK
ncbi:unnamed protein product [Moneuplotes crassus]|uniref:EamA domain-containing protein n=1 Tax=Euplotes crassus TaxID=5936 RepID=A0AAD1UUL1_EUPCR|nr:unnamed protein product [Moneuplotes crassus]